MDMRVAVERILSYSYWKNPTTNQPYNLTANSPNNLYFIAMGNRSQYGATGGAKYVWTRSLAQMRNTPPVDLDIGEVYECVRVLKEVAGIG
jgi:hypothetical protein